MSSCSSKLTVKTIPHNHTVPQITDFSDGVNNVLNSTVLNSNSANWQSTFQTVSSLSALWSSGNTTLIQDNSACWNQGCDVYSSYNSSSATNANISVVVQNNSALWATDANNGDVNVNNFVYDNSAIIIAVDTVVQTNSALWNTTVNDQANFVNVSGDRMTGNLSIYQNSNNTVLTFFSDPIGTNKVVSYFQNVTGEGIFSKYGDVWGDWFVGVHPTEPRFIFNYGNVGTLGTNVVEIGTGGTVHAFMFDVVDGLDSTHWDSCYTTVQSNSAQWAIDTTGDLSLIQSTSANWNTAYNQSNVFANNSSQYIQEPFIQNNFVNASGDTMTGLLAGPAATFTNITSFSSLSAQGEVKIIRNLSEAGDDNYIIANMIDPYNPTIGSLRIQPTSDSRRLFFGNAGHTFYAINLQYVQAFEHFPSTVATIGDFSFILNYASSFYWQHFPNSGGYIYPMLAAYESTQIGFDSGYFHFKSNMRDSVSAKAFVFDTKYTRTSGYLVEFVNNSDRKLFVDYSGSLSSANIIYDGHGNSIQWNNCYSTVQSNSAQWAIDTGGSGDANVNTFVYNNSAIIINVDTTVQTNSASWVGGGSVSPDDANLVIGLSMFL